MNDYLESNNLLSPFQSGFRNDSRTTDNIFVLKTLINKYVTNEKKNIYVSFIDFAKAFDTVWRPSLLNKLLKKGIGGNFYKVIKDMYTNTKCVCRQSNAYSEIFNTNLGVKQGDNLSPTLFNIFLDDFQTYLDQELTRPVKLSSLSFNHMFFADDLVLISETPSGLQECLSALEKYCKDWKLTVNSNKSNIITFSKKGKKHDMQKFYFNNNIIDSTKQYKYLGVVFTSNGLLKTGSTQLTERAKKAYYFLISKLSCHNLSARTILKLYKTMIKPIITYGSEIWISDYKTDLDAQEKNPFEKLQNHIFKNILGTHNKSTNLGITCELGEYPLSYSSYIAMFKYYKHDKRLLNMIESPNQKNLLLRSAFMEDCEISKWQKPLLDIKQKLSLPSLNIPIKDFEEKLQAYFEMCISDKLNNISTQKTGKLLFYSKVYKKFELQPYLKLPLKKNERTNLTRIRISSHNLAIETGRYHNPPIPRDQRFCFSCQTEIEDEEHFILYCPVYRDIRLKYNNIFQKQSNNISILEILNPEEISSAKNICMFLKTSLTMRKDILHGHG